MIEFTGLDYFIFQPGLLKDVFFLVSFALLGGGIKYVDDCFDEKVFSRANGFLFAPLLGLLWAFTMIQSPVAATILAAIVIGVAVKGKIDNLAFITGTLVILMVLLLFGVVSFLWIPLLALSLAGLLDEVANDWADKKLGMNRIARAFFEYRFFLKLTVLFFAITGTFEWVFFFAFILFDVAYMTVYEYVKRIVAHRKFYYHEPSNGIWTLKGKTSNGQKK